MEQFGEYVKMALYNIKENKGRSFLTMLGIIIGISSVITIVSIGNGLKADVMYETEIKSLTVAPNPEETSENAAISWESRQRGRRLQGSCRGKWRRGKESLTRM